MMSRTTGKSIQLVEHIRQSIEDILFTPIGSRIMRREYGSYIFKLLDQPFSDALALQIMAASATAIITWEDRVNLSNVQFTKVENGKFNIAIKTQILGLASESNFLIPLSYGAKL